MNTREVLAQPQVNKAISVGIKITSVKRHRVALQEAFVQTTLSRSEQASLHMIRFLESSDMPNKNDVPVSRNPNVKISSPLAFGIAMVICTNGFCDLIYTGASVFEFNLNTTRLDTTAPSIDVSMGVASGTFTTRNMTSHQIDSGATVGNLNPRVFFGLRTMDVAVVISNLQTSFIGTATYSGGGSNTAYTVTATGETSVWRHEDLNGNGFLEGPEPLHEIGKWPSVLGSSSTTGSFNYRDTFGTGSQTLLFEPNTSYVVLQDFFIDFAGTGSALDPPAVLSSDWTLPLAQHQTSFDFQAVPEPNAIYFLMICTSVLVIRRRMKHTRAK